MKIKTVMTIKKIFNMRKVKVIKKLAKMELHRERMVIQKYKTANKMEPMNPIQMVKKLT